MTDTDTLWKVEEIRDLMLEAGRIALSHFEAPETEHKADQSLVTAADREIEQFFTERLVAPQKNTTSRGIAAGATLLGEETWEKLDQPTREKLFQGATWVVDPIDGTAPYANHLPSWGISLGLLLEGRFAEGAIFLPCTGELFLTRDGHVLYEQGPRDPQRWTFENLQPLETPERPYRPGGMVALPHEIARTTRFPGPNPIQVNGCAVYSLTNLFLGNYLAYIAKIRLWDVAGAIPMLRNLGFLVQFSDGRELSSSVTDQDWVLDPRDRNLWKSRGRLYTARSPETLEKIRQIYQTP
ncbi:fructose-1,6-bisphosphatase [Alkalispirochaeta americana]|uniref:Fructose-1,6-bisphosphatase n=1 Tax=Alkalispirochaeta americana TaxID=159291 RepID=A0A1N6TUJ2_9SPIO|nr:inositol monophosphatase family protein [Alkalispirochaeta americana]SIQ57060.1 fructose-1,6-bisphosphatase [Alkalispirochaeta americana]